MEREKAPTMVGVTGWKAKPLTIAQVNEWVQPSFRAPTQTGFKFKPGNIGLHLDDGYIGVDVDAYGDHDGANTYQAAIEKWGELPATWASHSSREDGSRILLFRVPKGLKWPNNLNKLVGKGVDMIHTGHRYVMCWPSIHPEGRPYAWTRPDGTEAEPGEFPGLSDLPKLPKSWWRGITSGEKQGDVNAATAIGYDEAVDWVVELGREPTMCSGMKSTLKTWQQRVMAAGKGGFHDAARDGVWAILRDGRDGHQGVIGALNKLKKTFGVGVDADRDKDRLRLSDGEWQRMICGGVPRLISEDEPTDVEDPCLLIDQGIIRSSSVGVSDLELTELGNVARLAEITEGRLLWQTDMKTWVIWDQETGLWREDEIQPERWAIKSLQSLMETVAKDDGLDPKEKAAVRAFWRTAQKPTGISSTLGLYRGRPGASVLSSAFDSDEHVLGCPNGLVRLDAHGSTFRRMLTRDDRLTHVTAAAFNPDARSDDWETFLGRVQPSESVREWLARLVGYSLLGSNPARRIIVCMGPTTSGKGTFAGAVAAALGQYAATANLTIFRDNQDERPRADLADALFKRVIFLDEASHNWKLHPDQVKRMTGAGIISARRPFAKAAIHRMPSFTPWLMTNPPGPSIEGADAALRRRLIVVPFSETIAADEVDIMLAGRLVRDAGPAILAWAIAGYNDLVSLGMEEGLASPPEAWAVHEEFTSSMSELDAFISRLCFRGAQYKEAPHKLAEAWEQWQDAGNIQARDRISSRKFALELNANGFPLEQVRGDDGKSAKYRMGIRLGDGWEEVVNSGVTY